MGGTMKGICRREGKKARNEKLRGSRDKCMGGGTDRSVRGSLKGSMSGSLEKIRNNSQAGGGLTRIIKDRFLLNAGGFGMNELLGLAAALIIAGFVVIPGLRGLAEDILKGIEDWWSATIKGEIFSTSVVSVVQQLFLPR